MVTEPETETERETETEVGLAKDDLRQEGARPRGGGPREGRNRRIFGPYGHSLERVVFTLRTTLTLHFDKPTPLLIDRGEPFTDRQLISPSVHYLL